MKMFQVEIGPLVGTKRTLWLIGDVDALKVGDTLMTDSGEKVTIDAIGMTNRKVSNGLSILTAGNIKPGTKAAYIN